MVWDETVGNGGRWVNKNPQDIGLGVQYDWLGNKAMVLAADDTTNNPLRHNPQIKQYWRYLAQWISYSFPRRQW